MKRIQPRHFALGLSAGLLTLATACGGAGKVVTPITSGGSSATSTDVQPLALTVGNSMSFTPATLTVEAGRLIEMTLVNEGTFAHDFTLTEGLATPVKVDSPAGQTTRATFTPPPPGTYAFVCSVPGHALLGMRGRLVVR